MGTACGYRMQQEVKISPVYADDTALYSKYDQASDLWQQLELASELESDL